MSKTAVVIDYPGFFSWLGDGHDSQIFHQELWVGTSVCYRLKQISNIQKLLSSIFEKDHQSICHCLEVHNFPLCLSSRGKYFSHELAPFDLLMNYVQLVVLLLQYWVAIIKVDLSFSLNENESLLVDIALNVYDFIVH